MNILPEHHRYVHCTVYKILVHALQFSVFAYYIHIDLCYWNVLKV